MPDLVRVFASRWKSILLISLLAGLAALAVAWFSPKKYLSTTTAIPSNALTADKARLFNNNIQELYSEFGSPDELDRMEGTARLDTIYLNAIRKLQLIHHYGLQNEKDSLLIALEKLKDDSKIMRSAYGELTVKVWDQDPQTSAAIANDLLEEIQTLQQDLQVQNNAEALQGVSRAYDSLKATVSVKDSSIADADYNDALHDARLGRLLDYEKLMAEYKLSIQTRPRTLLVEEYARAAVHPDKPRILLTVIIGLLAGFLCGYFIALYQQSRS